MNYEPNNNYAEENVIGSMVHESENIDIAASILTAGSFFSSQHGFIFDCILELKAANEVVDIFTVPEKGKEKGRDIDLEYLTRVVMNTPKVANCATYSKHVADKFKEREMIAAHEKSIAKIKSGEGSTSERLHHSIANVNAIDPDSNDSAINSVKMKDIALDWLDKYEEKINNPELKGLTLGIDGLDDIIGERGIQPGDVVVIAARPKMFKTATMTKIANHIGLELKKPLQILSMEMKNNLMFERTLTQETGVTNNNFHKVMGDDDYARVHGAVGRLIDTEMYIDDRSNLTLRQVQKEVRAMSKLHGGYGSLGGVMLDYFTLMDLEENKGNPSFGYAQLSKGIVSLAKEVGCPIFLLCQLNRECEKRPDKRPMPFDLGDTGQLERDASIIIMLYNDEVYCEDSPQKGLLELIIRVNRNGGKGTAYQTTTGGRLGDIGAEDIGRMMAESQYQERMNSNGK